MKKKKLKKKIKKLEKKVEKYRGNLLTLIKQIDISLTKKITNLSNAYTNKFNKFNPDVINNRIDGLCMDVNYLRSSIKGINGRCDILDRRTQTDYNKIAKNEEKTCDTCDYLGLSGCGTQCVECSANNKKETENGN